MLVGDVVDDADMGFKLVNVLEKFNDMTSSTEEESIRRKKNVKWSSDPINQTLLDNHKAEFVELIKSTKFLRSDGVSYITDGVTIEGIFSLILFLDDPITRDFRTANSDVFIRHISGDETLDLEGVINEQSSDPIKMALRERMLDSRCSSVEEQSQTQPPVTT